MFTNKLSDTLTHGNLKLKVTVRSQTTMDYYAEVALIRKLYQLIEGKPYTSETIWTPTARALNDYVSILVQTEVVNGLPKSVAWATKDSSDKDLKQAYESFIQLPRPITQQWVRLIDKADEPPGDPDLFPYVSEGKESDPESGKKEPTSKAS